MTDTQKVYVLNDAADAWPTAEDLAAMPDAGGAVVELEGRQIQAEKLIECWRWLFGE